MEPVDMLIKPDQGVCVCIEDYIPVGWIKENKTPGSLGIGGEATTANPKEPNPR